MGSYERVLGALPTTTYYYLSLPTITYKNCAQPINMRRRHHTFQFSLFSFHFSVFTFPRRPILPSSHHPIVPSSHRPIVPSSHCPPRPIVPFFFWCFYFVNYLIFRNFATYYVFECRRLHYCYRSYRPITIKRIC